jgi:hypothetical protein
MHNDSSLTFAPEKGSRPVILGDAFSSYPAACNRKKKDPDR